MFIRDHNGNLKKIYIKKITSEKELYTYIWKTKYNININNIEDPVDIIVDYIEN